MCSKTEREMDDPKTLRVRANDERGIECLMIRPRVRPVYDWALSRSYDGSILCEVPCVFFFPFSLAGGRTDGRC